MKTVSEKELEEQYFICRNLTSNKSFQTHLAMCRDNEENLYSLVIKEMDKKRADIYSVLSNMWNPYIAETYEVICVNSSDSSNYYVAITECVYAENSPEEECLTLTQYVHKLGPLKEKTALSICVQICEGLNEFHEKGFVHRDVKPDNIMISKYDIEDPQIKIIDFGGAKVERNIASVDTTVIGTLGYQAPESISSGTSNRSDIYSIGCILNFMLTGQEPGIIEYKGNHYIEAIIEKATNLDASYRYHNTSLFQKNLEHEIGKKFIDRIPFLRALPGFRTHTLWKKLIALICYITAPHLWIFCINSFGITGLLEIFFFYVIIPMIVGFNMGNLLRFFPKDLRKNNQLFLIIRTLIILVSIIGPVIVDYLILGGNV